MTTRTGLQPLLIRIATLAAPLLLLVCLYVLYDPFEVLRPSQSFYGSSHLVPLNRDYVSTECYLRHPRRRDLDSFILGNSRSLFFRTADWVTFLGPAVPFHFDASGESVFGLLSKVRLLQKNSRRIRNVLIIMDAETLSVTTDSSGYLLQKDPRVAGTSVANFHYQFFTAFLYPQFFVRYLGYRLTGSVKPWMGDGFQDGPREVLQLPATNDLVVVGKDREMQREGEAFFTALAKRYPRDLSRRPEPGPPVIGPAQISMLSEIQSILTCDNADVRVVINPLYDRVPLNPADAAQLRRIFGPGRVYDFSGANAFTNDVHNYYEQSHYRLNVARQILQIVYAHPAAPSR